VGYTNSLQQQYQTNRIIFSPEFLREGNALHDNLYPSRIIVGNEAPESACFAQLLLQGALAPEVETMLMASAEAEAVNSLRTPIWPCAYRFSMNWIRTH
jgi:UDPglucose 6-dehydrogenase